jgi:hypothetical protein
VLIVIIDITQAIGVLYGTFVAVLFFVYSREARARWHNYLFPQLVASSFQLDYPELEDYENELLNDNRTIFPYMNSISRLSESVLRFSVRPSQSIDHEIDMRVFPNSNFSNHIIGSIKIDVSNPINKVDEL